MKKTQESIVPLITLLAMRLLGNRSMAQFWAAMPSPATAWAGIACSTDGLKIAGASVWVPGLPYGYGPIYHSTDGGATWQLTGAPATNWSAITCSDGPILVAVSGGRYGSIFISTNSGATWTQLSAPLTNWVTVTCSADGTKMAAAGQTYPNGGPVYLSTDAGNTWNPALLPSDGWISIASSADGSRLVAASDNYGTGAIYVSADSGATWTRTSVQTNVGWTVAISADGSRLFAGPRSYPSGCQACTPIYRSTDFGLTWIPTPSPLLPWTLIACSGDGSKLVADSGGSIFVSADSGASWRGSEAPEAPYNSWNAAVCSADGSRLLLSPGFGNVFTLQQGPTLHISPTGTNLLLSWPDYAAGFVLQQSPAAHGADWLDVPVAPTDAGQQNQITVSISTNSYFYRLYANLAPAITNLPGDQTVAAGTNVIFSVHASSSTPLTDPMPIAYQWELNGVPLPGQTNNTLSLTDVQAANAGVYTVIVSNSVASVSTAPATLSVADVPPLLWSDFPNRVAIAGTFISLAASIHGSEPLAYQWHANGTNIPGATLASLSFPNVQPSDVGRYSVTVTNTLGSLTTRAALLTVKSYPLPPTAMVAWGDNSLGQTNVALTESNAVALAAGEQQTIYLRMDGTMGDFGQQLRSDYTPFPPMAAIALRQYSYGGYGLALASNAVPIAFGITVLSGASDVPVSVTNVVAIASGNPGLAVKDDGTVSGWLHLGTIDYSGILPFLPSLSNVVDIAMGEFVTGGLDIAHCLALKSDHTVVAWGNNAQGENSIPPGLTNVIAISAGIYHDLVLKRDGTVRAWGDNSLGQTNAPPALTNVVAISAGGFHNLALLANGTVVAWGDNTYGQCAVPAGLTNVVYVSAGRNYSTALVRR
ncbi:MAG TPA: immunoglobulin domain-containing protein [Candidatus Binatia bacterium]|jgi:hypothetical protein|nr:immunoglobulin domain-containing protein [Candidatus Binatia bacterium]